MRLLGLCFVFAGIFFPAFAEGANETLLQIKGQACETLLSGESRSGARIRAADKAVFNAIKKQPSISALFAKLNDHDTNVLIYRLADEYIEDLSVRMLPSSDENVCVEIGGRLSEQLAKEAFDAFMIERSSFRETKPEIIEQIVHEVGEEIALTPDNPHDLALLYIADLEFFDGTTSQSYTQTLKQMYADNPYFYLTEDSEIADYIIYPKVLTAKVEKTGEKTEQLHMVVVLEIKGLTAEISGEYQNRFVVLDVHEDKQKTATKMLEKLITLAAQKLLAKIEEKEQRKLERKNLGRVLGS